VCGAGGRGGGTVGGGGGGGGSEPSRDSENSLIPLPVIAECSSSVYCVGPLHSPAAVGAERDSHDPSVISLPAIAEYTASHTATHTATHTAAHTAPHTAIHTAAAPATHTAVQHTTAHCNTLQHTTADSNVVPLRSPAPVTSDVGTLVHPSHELEDTGGGRWEGGEGAEDWGGVRSWLSALGANKAQLSRSPPTERSSLSPLEEGGEGGYMSRSPLGEESRWHGMITEVTSPLIMSVTSPLSMSVTYPVTSTWAKERGDAKGEGVCCSVLQCVAVRCSVLWRVVACCSVLQCVAVCCNVLQCVAVCCSVLQCYEHPGERAWRRERRECVLQCVAVCCSVLQCVAVCCSVL